MKSKIVKIESRIQQNSKFVYKFDDIEVLSTLLFEVDDLAVYIKSGVNIPKSLFTRMGDHNNYIAKENNMNSFLIPVKSIPCGIGMTDKYENRLFIVFDNSEPIEIKETDQIDDILDLK